jgi:hypothetical protein
MEWYVVKMWLSWVDLFAGIQTRGIAAFGNADEFDIQQKSVTNLIIAKPIGLITAISYTLFGHFIRNYFPNAVQNLDQAKLFRGSVPEIRILFPVTIV